jgi:hypothetical protein
MASSGFRATRIACRIGRIVGGAPDRALVD